jgi:5-(carboxyamino)imidazole ribonucleotide synthase
LFKVFYITVMKTPSIIGFIGDGQLARLSALAAKNFGFKCVFYGENPNGPCQNLGSFVTGKLDDIVGLQTFAKQVDVITLENEFITADILQRLEKLSKVPIYPTPASFALIENKINEKATFAKAGLPIGDYLVTRNPKIDIEEAIEKWGLPLMLKKSKGAYDGQGNKLLRDLTQLDHILLQWQLEDGEAIIVERFLDFAREVAITVARNQQGEIKIYPVVDTIQKDHICTHVVAPAQNISKDDQLLLQQYATTAMEYLRAVGVFSFEFFILKNGTILFNESAPRPHNSAHYTLDACVTSQFENHIRAICDMKLGDTRMTVPLAVMVNLLGASNRQVDLSVFSHREEDNVYVHPYGKRESRVGRKMGHLTVTGAELEILMNKADFIKSNIRI